MYTVLSTPSLGIVCQGAPLNLVFMNSRDLDDLAKRLHIAQCVRDHHLEFVPISETGRHDFPVSVLNRLSGSVEFTWQVWGHLTRR